MPGYVLGLDIGGTFTDFVLLSEELDRRVLFKHLTTYPNPSDGVIQGLRLLLQQEKVEPSHIRAIVHSTTLVTNAIIERDGAPAGLLTTEGFRHVPDLGDEQRYDTYDLHLDFPEPLVPDHLRCEVRERMDRDGNPLTPLDPEDAAAAVRHLVEAGARSLAVSFLHAYRNDAHEKEMLAIIRQLYPDIPVSLSSEVSPMIGEWVRTTTVCADAYVKPIVARYLETLETELARLGFRGRFYMMLSNGGMATTDTAARFPIRLLESGPAAGALAAGFYGRMTGHDDVLAFDMGGTTAKACLIEGGWPRVGERMEAARVHRFKPGSGLPIQVPSVELIEIGAGGGSIAWIDELGLLRVGPQSASSSPGPACYGLGGAEPTVTDANLLLGYLNPDYFLGGRMRLDVDAARAAVRRLSEQLSLDMAATAWGIHQTVNENMAGAARMHVIERGHDPRRFTIVASGGAGPCHATAVARILGATKVILPPGAGTLSALGCLAAPLSFDASHSYLAPLDDAPWDEINGLVTAMTSEGRRLVVAAGADPEAVEVQVSAEMRMRGQFHTVTVPMPPGPLTSAQAAEIRRRFHERYVRLYARTNEQMPLEFVTWRVSVSCDQRLVPFVRAEDAPRPGRSADAAIKGRRPACFSPDGTYVDTPVYDRAKLAFGMEITGPAVIEEPQSTALLRPGDVAVVDSELNLIVEVVS